MAELSAAFLDMAEKLQARSDRIQTFATHVSHELKSPLTAIQGAAELLRDSGDGDGRGRAAALSNNIVTDAGRLNLLVRRLLELARAENLAPSGESTSLAAALALLPADNRLAVRDRGGRRYRACACRPRTRQSCLPISSTIRPGTAPTLVSLSAASADGKATVAGQRRRRRHFAEQPGAHLRAVLHHAARDRRHRHGPRHRAGPPESA